MPCPLIYTPLLNSSWLVSMAPEYVTSVLCGGCAEGPFERPGFGFTAHMGQIRLIMGSFEFGQQPRRSRIIVGINVAWAHFCPTFD